MMKINCDKCGYILGGIEVKENYGCNACNPFYLSIPTLKDTSMVGGNTHSAVNSEPVVDTACKYCGQINGFHLDGCITQQKWCVHNKNIKGVYTECQICKMAEYENTMPKAPTRPPLPIKYCGICARILIQTSIGTYYDHDTAEQYHHWRFTCPEYRWWKIWDRYHTNYRCNEDGSTYAYEA